jgi:hypothetical protein
VTAKRRTRPDARTNRRGDIVLMIDPPADIGGRAPLGREVEKIGGDIANRGSGKELARELDIGLGDLKPTVSKPRLARYSRRPPARIRQPLPTCRSGQMSSPAPSR